MNEIRLPRVVEKIIGRLEAAGFEAYAVGGCVRDSLLGRIPEDWDITTSAKPEEVKRVFHRTVDTGIEHGTVTVMMGGEDSLLHGVHGYEVTTYRIDGAYLDGRHPSSVAFTPSLKEDLARRDFTINAMAYNTRSGIVDVFGGVEDLEKGVIRAVGNPEHRFEEDALRMLRALRFSAQLGFYIEDSTFEAVKRLAPNLGHVSKERIAVELGKLLTSAHPNRIRMVFDTGLAPYVCRDFGKIEMSGGVLDKEKYSGIDKADCTSAAKQVQTATEIPAAAERSCVARVPLTIKAGKTDAAPVLLWQRTDKGQIPWLAALQSLHKPDEHSQNAINAQGVQNTQDIQNVQNWEAHAAAGHAQSLHGKRYLAWGMLLRGVPKLVKPVLKELKLDNDTIRQADVIASLFGETLPETESDVRRCLSCVGYELFYDYLAVREAVEAERSRVLCDAPGAQKMSKDSWQRGLQKQETAECCVKTIVEEAQETQQMNAEAGEAAVSHIQSIRSLTEAVQRRGDCIDLKTLAVSGQDLMDAGIPKGPEIGRILKAMLADVLETPVHNRKDYLMAQHGNAQ